MKRRIRERSRHATQHSPWGKSGAKMCIRDRKYGEAVGAFIILHEGVEMNEFDVRDFCDGKIARYKIPKYIFFVDEFPMTGSGKIQKFKLKDVGLELCRKQGIEII